MTSQLVTALLQVYVRPSELCSVAEYETAPSPGDQETLAVLLRQPIVVWTARAGQAAEDRNSKNWHVSSMF